MKQGWTQIGGRFANGIVSVGIGAAYDYVVKHTKERTMEDLDITEQGYDSFCRLVCKKLTVNRMYWPEGFRL